MTKIPAEAIAVNQCVRAVKHGPVGVVRYHSNGWTVVDYPRGTANYEHGKDSLYLVDTPGTPSLSVELERDLYRAAYREIMTNPGNSVMVAQKLRDAGLEA